MTTKIETMDGVRFRKVVEKGIEVRVTVDEANAVLDFYLARAANLIAHGGSPDERAGKLLSVVDKIEWWRSAVETLSQDEDLRY